MYFTSYIFKPKAQCYVGFISCLIMVYITLTSTDGCRDKATRFTDDYMTIIYYELYITYL